MALAEALLDRAPAEAEACACAHCDLPVPRALRAPAGHSFCCHGCAAAWEIIHASGLERYYDLSERREAAVRPEGSSFAPFDHAAFHALYVTRRADGRAETELYLEGVHCSSCVWLIERVPLAIPGVTSAELDVARARVRLVWNAGDTRLSPIARFPASLGYRPRPFRGRRADEARRAEDRAMLVRIGVSGAIAGNVMTLALALYSGWFGGMEPTYEHYFRWVSLLLATPSVLGPGRLFFRGAWAAVRTRTPHMDLPIAVAIGGGFARGAINTVTGHGPIYFDGVTALVFLLLVGRFLQQRAQRAAADSAELLHGLAPSSARLVEEAGIREIPIEALLPGMVFACRAGDVVAADGVVTRGRSDLDRSLLTGESRPVSVVEGDRVFAGATNRGAPLEIRAEATGESSRLGRILGEVERASRTRAPVVEAANRRASVFVVVVLALAVVTGAIGMRRGASEAIDRAIALLIVTCPCALALATPLALTSAIGRAARAGILIKNGPALERLASPGTLLLDKTGTVTEGRLRLASWRGPESARALVLALERGSNHPIAAAFEEAWPDLEPADPDAVEHVLGGGVSGQVAGHQIVVGSAAFVRARLAPGSRPAPPDDAFAARCTTVWVAIDGAPAARAAFEDRIRPEAGAALALLRARGWRVRLLSGDDARVVDDVGARLGFSPAECRGEATPEEKLAEVERALASGPVVMVGDGVNDAAAIARASVGIGVRGGAEACLAAADVFLARPGLEDLVALTEGATRCVRVIRRGMRISLLYNLAGASLAIAGVVNPLIAAVLMPLSSLTVILLAFRSRTFGGATS
jgi:Cu2+-exporting ATPase